MLYEAFNQKVFHTPAHWNPLTSPMLDWLSITIYVTRADRALLTRFLSKFLDPSTTTTNDVKPPSAKTNPKPSADHVSFAANALNSQQTVPKPSSVAETAMTAPLMSDQLGGTSVGEEEQEDIGYDLADEDGSASEPEEETSIFSIPARFSVRPGKKRRAAQAAELNAPFGVAAESGTPNTMCTPAPAGILNVPVRMGIASKAREAGKKSQLRAMWQTAGRAVVQMKTAGNTFFAHLKHRSFPGAYVVCKSSHIPDAYVLTILVDDKLNRFDHHVLQLRDGVVCVDSKALSEPPCTSLQSALQRLSIAPEHISLPLRQPAPVGIRDDYMTEAVKHYNLLSGASLQFG